MRHRWRPWIALTLAWLLVLAGIGAMVVVWHTEDSVDAAQVLGTVVALAVMLSGGCAVLWRWARSGHAVRRSAVARLTVGSRAGRLQALHLVDLSDLGVRVPRESSGVTRGQLEYAARHLLDPQLRIALRERRFVLVHGPSAAGKSRSTAEIARELHNRRRVLVPVAQPGALTELLDAGAVESGTVVWLDDLDRHIDAGVDSTVVRRLLETDRVLVVATIRASAFEQIKPRGELRPPGRDLVELAVLHDGVVGFTGWDDADREQAAQQYAEQPDVVTALRNGMGLGEYLAAAPELVERAEAGHPPSEGLALLRATTDWYRCGMTRPAPVHLVRKLYPLYLPADDATLLDRFDQALNWACAPVSGGRLVTHRTDGSGLAVHDYYLDHVARRSLPPIPAPALDAIAEELKDAPDDLLRVGIALHYQGSADQAERWFRGLAADGNAVAMFNLGLLLEELGRVDEAERWYRGAATAGDTSAMNNLGLLLRGRGRVDEAERWYRGAATAGDTSAMINLGILLVKRGDPEEAERRFRAAVTAGQPVAMHNLGLLVEEQGDLGEAERWYHLAATAGVTEASVNLGRLLRDRGAVDEAERWYRTAAAAGDTGGMTGLGVLLEERGGVDEAERWLRAAATAGEAAATYNLALLLHERGDLADAERWFRVALAAGHDSAKIHLGLLFAAQGDLAEAERWYRPAGNPEAINKVGLWFALRGNPRMAERCYRAAASAGHPDAMRNLGEMLAQHGDRKESKRWFKAAREIYRGKARESSPKR